MSRGRPFSLTSSLTTGPRTGRVLSEAEATALGSKLLDMVSNRSIGITIEHMATGITKVANGRVLATDDGDDLTITFSSSFGSGLPVSISTNQLNEVTLKKVIEQAKGFATPLPRAEDMEPDDPDDPKYFTYNKREYMPVSLYHDTTVSAMETVRGDVLPRMITLLVVGGDAACFVSGHRSEEAKRRKLR